MNRQSQIRDFGRRSGLKVYPVSIGAMRLPDQEQAISLMRKAIDVGMVYIDTSRGYGESEIKVGKSLKDGYREKVILSTKWAPWITKIEETDDASADCTYKRILESMERLDVGYLDFYQIWNICKPEYYQQVIAKGGMLDGVRRAVDEGLVGHIGFTTHDSPENISRYIDEADWCEAILFTYNMLNPTYKQVIQKAHEKGIATIVMNPVGGGMFAEDSAVLNRTVSLITGSENAVETAHRYLRGDENVDTILCGIVRPSDIESTIANYQKPPLTAGQIRRIEEAMSKLSSKSQGFCTGCRYCMPCPQGINIPAMMSVVYYHKLLRVPGKAKDVYNWVINPNNEDISKLAADCVQCGECEKKCTQQLNIMDELNFISKNYEDKK